jgi:hypothetical protein
MLFLSTLECAGLLKTVCENILHEETSSQLRERQDACTYAYMVYLTLFAIIEVPLEQTVAIAAWPRSTAQNCLALASCSGALTRKQKHTHCMIFSRILYTGTLFLTTFTEVLLAGYACKDILLGFFVCRNVNTHIQTQPSRSCLILTLWRKRQRLLLGFCLSQH